MILCMIKPIYVLKCFVDDLDDTVLRGLQIINLGNRVIQIGNDFKELIKYIKKVKKIN
jgi:predicted enzyme involved in methoxymalonyl-ACP biosynthesis